MAGEPIIKLDAGLLGDLSAKASGISTGIDTPVNGIANILGALDWKVKSQSGVEYDLKNVSNELRKQESQLSSWNRVIVDAIGRIDTTTATLNAKTDAIAMQAAAAASRGKDLINVGSAAAAMSAVAAALTASLSFQTSSLSTSISSGIKNWFYNLFHGNNHDSHVGGSGGGHSSGGGMHDGTTNYVGGVCDEFGNSVLDTGEGRLTVIAPDGSRTIMTREEYSDYCAKKKSDNNKTQTQETPEQTVPTGKTKSYENSHTGEGYVISSYNDGKYNNLWQRDYALPHKDKNEGENVACQACCLCMMYNMTHGTHYKMVDINTVEDVPESENFRNLNPSGVYRIEKEGNHEAGSVKSLDNLQIQTRADEFFGYPLKDPDGTKRLTVIEQEIKKGYPVMVAVSSSDYPTHYVLVVGLKNGHGSPPTESDLIVANPSNSSHEARLLKTGNYHLTEGGNIWTYSG